MGYFAVDALSRGIHEAGLRRGSPEIPASFDNHCLGRHPSDLSRKGYDRLQLDCHHFPTGFGSLADCPSLGSAGAY